MIATMKRITLCAASVLAVAAFAVPVLAAPHVQPHLLLRGTPIGQGTLDNDITANFFLSEKVLGSQVHARIAGHNAKVVHVGGSHVPGTFLDAEIVSGHPHHLSGVAREERRAPVPI